MKISLSVFQARKPIGPVELVVSPYTGNVSGSWLIGGTSVTRNGSAGGNAIVTLSTAIDTGKNYRVRFTVTNLSGDTFFWRLGGAGTAREISANGAVDITVAGGGTNPSINFGPWAGGAGEVTITNLSVQEV